MGTAVGPISCLRPIRAIRPPSVRVGSSREPSRTRAVPKLIYSAITSLDGYVSGSDGDFDWAAPDEEVHSFINDLQRPVGTYVYGRRMYEVMQAWETLGQDPQEPAYIADFADLWRATDKVVYSTTLGSVATPRTRLASRFDADDIRRLKDETDRDLTIGGPGLAAEALRGGVVDECQLFVVPTVVGGGIPFFPADLRLRLELTDERRFAGGMVFLRYAVRP